MSCGVSHGFTEWFRNSTRCRIVFPTRWSLRLRSGWSGIWCRVSHEFTEWWLVIWRSVVVSCCVPGVDSQILRLWRTVVSVSCIPPVYGVVGNLVTCCVFHEFTERLWIRQTVMSSRLWSGWVVENLSTCRVVCHTRFTEWLGIWRHGCRVSHEFTNRLGIWRPVVSCVPRIYGVGGNSTTCRVVVFNDDQDDGCSFQKYSNYTVTCVHRIWQSHAYIISDNHIRVSYMIITCVHHTTITCIHHMCVSNVCGGTSGDNTETLWRGVSTTYYSRCSSRPTPKSRSKVYVSGYTKRKMRLTTRTKWTGWWVSNVTT